jgi:hypothetical protein
MFQVPDVLIGDGTVPTNRTGYAHHLFDHDTEAYIGKVAFTSGQRVRRDPHAEPRNLLAPPPTFAAERPNEQEFVLHLV